MDPGAQFTAPVNGQAAQLLPNNGNVDPSLASFIQTNTGGSSSAYTWSGYQVGNGTVTPTDPNAAVKMNVPAGSICLTAECAAGISPVANPIRNAADIQNDIANGASTVSRGAVIVGGAATTAAEIPGPHQPLAAETAITAAGVGFAADVVEQIVRPDPQKYFKEQLLIGIPANVLTEKFPLYAPFINEVAEKIKSGVQ